ncbi:MAG: hypothetical protein RLZZ468_227 [Cyanobacteriota bacterium]
METTITIAGRAGRITGTIARGLIWAYHEIDWAEVAALVIACLQVLIVALLLAGRATRRAWDALPVLSERLGRWYSHRLVEPARVTPAGTLAPARPALAAARRRDLEQLTQRQLMALAGTRRKLAKRQLIALVTATAMGVA